MAGLSILKHMHNLSDEDLVENVGERVLDIAGRQASRVKFDRQPLDSRVRPESAARTLETKGSGVSRTCGAE